MHIKNILFMGLCLFIGTASAQDKMSKTKKAIITSVEKHEGELIKISDEIWALAETAFEEHQSSKLLSDYAEKQGFKVERGVAGMPTAFVATMALGNP